MVPLGKNVAFGQPSTKEQDVINKTFLPSPVSPSSPGQAWLDLAKAFSNANTAQSGGAGGSSTPVYIPPAYVPQPNPPSTATTSSPANSGRGDQGSGSAGTKAAISTTPGLGSAGKKRNPAPPLVPRNADESASPSPNENDAPIASKDQTDAKAKALADQATKSSDGFLSSDIGSTNNKGQGGKDQKGLLESDYLPEPLTEEQKEEDKGIQGKAKIDDQRAAAMLNRSEENRAAIDKRFIELRKLKLVKDIKTPVKDLSYEEKKAMIDEVDAATQDALTSDKKNGRPRFTAPQR